MLDSKIFISELQVKESVCFWLKEKHGIDLLPQELKINYVEYSHNGYEDFRQSFNGFEAVIPIGEN